MWVGFDENVSPIDRDNPENFWNSILMNEISYLNKSHPLKNKFLRSHTWPFFDVELGTIKKD